MKSVMGGAGTRLSENQARILAHWWGGAYCRLEVRRGQGPGHGVVLDRAQLSTPGGPVISWEEAQAVENRRPLEANPHTPDWPG